MRQLAGGVAFRGGGFAPRTLPLAGAVTLLGLVAAWQLADSFGAISTLFLPAPANKSAFSVAEAPLAMRLKALNITG